MDSAGVVLAVSALAALTCARGAHGLFRRAMYLRKNYFVTRLSFTVLNTAVSGSPKPIIPDFPASTRPIR